jgi:hypothetical protein
MFTKIRINTSLEEISVRYLACFFFLKSLATMSSKIVVGYACKMYEIGANVSVHDCYKINE